MNQNEVRPKRLRPPHIIKDEESDGCVCTVVEHGLLIADELVALDSPRRIDEDGVELAQRSQVVVPQVAVDERTIGPTVRFLCVGGVRVGGECSCRVGRAMDRLVMCMRTL